MLGGEARPQDAPWAASEPGQGQGPGSAATPPRRPGLRPALGTGHTAGLDGAGLAAARADVLGHIWA